MKKKKRKYLEACLKQKLHYSPFVITVDRILRVGTKATLKRITYNLAAKWKQPHFCMCGYVKSQVTIYMV